MAARRLLVTDQKQQPDLIRQADDNHSPIITVDEIRHHDDADAIASTIGRGVGMAATFTARRAPT